MLSNRRTNSIGRFCAICFCMIGIEVLVLLFLAAVVAGTIDSIAGGGGLITMPALLLAGIPPAAAVATNKLQSSFGTLTATTYFLRKKLISLRENALPLALISMGAITGGWVITLVSPRYLNYLIPIVLIAIGSYFLFFAKNLDRAGHPRLSRNKFNVLVTPFFGFYDGFLGPGTGSLVTASLVTLRGMPIRSATAHAKLYNFCSNLSALIYFIFFGKMVWVVGLVMIAGQFLGAWLGARIAFSHGARVIRPMTVIICFVMSLSLLMTL